jgi:hypothetical protein
MVTPMLRSLSFSIACPIAIVLLCVRVSLADEPVNQLTDAERLAGWELLFDGKSADQFRNYKKDDLGDGWKIADGAIVRTGKGAGDIVTKKKYKYFEISLEYKISKGGNSGLMFHVTEDNKAPWHSGPEIQIQDNVDGHDPQKAGWLYQLYQPKIPAWAKRPGDNDAVDATRPAGEWNQLYLRIADSCEVCLNGVSYFKFKVGDKDWDKRVAKSKFSKFADFGKAGEGYICLQDHGDEVAFRNIKIRELNGPEAPNPITGKSPAKAEIAFPKITWENWEPIDDNGKARALRPIIMTHAGDGTNRMFVGSQVGMIHSFKPNSDVDKAKMFLDIRDRVKAYWGNGANEEGLLGLAFHPDYKSNGEFFVYYTSASKDTTSIVSRFRVSRDPNVADAASEEVLMELKQPFMNHNGGSIAFGKDGYLYIGLGDGGSRNDPYANGQNLKTLLGSILRIDVNTKSNGKNYGIPSDNPFVGRDDARPEIYAYGFRNPWRLSFDRKTGDLWVADVGQDLWEEINLVRKGGNYGWSIRESAHPFGNRVAPNPEKPLLPVWEYDHQVGKSITGGALYRGPLAELNGKYIYSDYVSGRIWELDYDPASGKVRGNKEIKTDKMPVLSFGEDEAGEVYYSIAAPNGVGIYKFTK